MIITDQFSLQYVSYITDLKKKQSNVVASIVVIGSEFQSWELNSYCDSS